MTLMIRRFDWRRALLHGVTLAAENHRDHDTPEAWTAMWELLREAAAVSRSWDAPPRSGFPDRGSWPETPDEITTWQRQMAYLQGTLDEAPQEEPEPPVPSAAEVTRAEAVLNLWHDSALIVGGQPHRHKRAVWRLAEGAFLGSVTRMTGLHRSEVLALRKRAATDMLRAAGVEK